MTPSQCVLENVDFFQSPNITSNMHHLARGPSSAPSLNIEKGQKHVANTRPL